MINRRTALLLPLLCIAGSAARAAPAPRPHAWERAESWSEGNIGGMRWVAVRQEDLRKDDLVRLYKDGVLITRPRRVMPWDTGASWVVDGIVDGAVSLRPTPKWV